MSKINLTKEKLHSPEQLAEKERCIDESVVRFIQDYKAGKMNNRLFLHHRIENLAVLVKEYHNG